MAAGISDQEAQEICNDVLERLSKWPALAPALQSGGLEVKASGIVCNALERFSEKSGSVVLREYEHMDFALINPRTVPGSRLDVGAVVEAKFNYARQCGEIRARLPAAVVQAEGYRQRFKAAFAYVLYLVAAPEIKEIPQHPRDSGWGYWNGKLQTAIDATHAATTEAGVRILAEASHASAHPLYCALIEAGPRPSAPL